MQIFFKNNGAKPLGSFTVTPETEMEKSIITMMFAVAAHDKMPIGIQSYTNTAEGGIEEFQFGIVAPEPVISDPLESVDLVEKASPKTITERINELWGKADVMPKSLVAEDDTQQKLPANDSPAIQATDEPTASDPNPVPRIQSEPPPEST